MNWFSTEHGFAIYDGLDYRAYQGFNWLFVKGLLIIACLAKPQGNKGSARPFYCRFIGSKQKKRL